MIVKSITLLCSPPRAFELFTQHASDWWPPERRHTNDASSTIAMLETGRFFERAGDGREVELGRVLAWRVGEELVLDWFPGTDADHPTRVVVSFVPDGETTRITIEHGPTPASDELYPSRAPRYAASWDLVLAALDRYYTLEHR